MQHQEVRELYNEYVEAEGSKLQFEHFSTLVIFYPSLSVVLSDDIIDDEEWVFIEYLAKFMSDTFKTELEGDESKLEHLRDTFYQDLKCLLKNHKRWEDRFLKVLKGILERHEDIKSTIVETLYLFADASEGTSDHESTKIAELKEYLNIKDEDYE